MGGAINQFRGPYSFLSNFFQVPIRLGNSTYPSVEHAYQAAKTKDKKLRKKIAHTKTATEAKRLGSRVPLRDDWEEIKDTVMYRAVKAKFTRNHFLGTKLINTGSSKLIEGNWWGDTYWGVFEEKGKNKLGKILMAVRDELKHTQKKSSSRTRQESVLALLSNGGWYSTMEICDVTIGGSEGCRRLRSLRNAIRKGNYPGHKDIIKRRAKTGTQYEYKLIMEE